MNIVGTKPLMAAIVAWDRTGPGFSPTSLERCFYTAKTQRGPAIPESKSSAGCCALHT